MPPYVDYGDEEEEDSQQIWYRESHHSPGCPCCIEGTGFPRPPSSALGGSDYGGALRKASRASTHISTNSAESEAGPGPGEKDPGAANPTRDNTVRVRRSVSSFGLRMKKSMGHLTRRPSGSLR